MKKQKPKVIIVSGSINSGKTTTSKYLVERFENTAHVHGDSLRHFVTWQALEDSISITHQNIISVAKNFLEDGYNVVIDYPFYKEHFERLSTALSSFSDSIHAFVMSPPLKAAQKQRGERVLSQQEVNRIAYHYQTDLHNPEFGIWTCPKLSPQFSSNKFKWYFLASSLELVYSKTLKLIAL